MTELEDPRVIDVLLVEDDEGDVLMTREAFEYYKIQNRLHVVGDGEQALQFLRRTGPYADAPRPGLILLDVNLPRRSGMEVLKELKEDDELLMIPVIMLTTSQAEEDIVRSYSLHANAFISKPVDFEHFIEAIRQIDTFFLTGLATDFCVAWSAVDARKFGFTTYVIEDATRAIDLNGSLATAWKQMTEAGVKRIQSSDVAMS